MHLPLGSVSLVCHGLNAQIEAFPERPLKNKHQPHLYLEATDLHGRLNKTPQVSSRAVVVAMGAMG